MKPLELADRYSRSVFEIAEERGVSSNVFDELQMVRKAMEKRPELMNLLQNPLITRNEKSSLIEGVLGPKSTPLSRQFINLLVDKNRIDLFPFVVDELEQSIREKEGVQEVTILTARELHPSIIQLIQKALERTIHKKILIQTETEKNLIGGLQIQIGNRLIDGSVRGKLNTLETQLRNAKV